MPSEAIPFPVKLTVASWQKSTGISKPQHTGIKGMLTDLKNDYDVIDWNKFYPILICDPLNGVNAPRDIEPKMQETAKYYKSAVKPLQKKALQLSKKAREVADDLKKKKLVTKKNSKACEEIQSEASAFAAALKDNSVYFNKVSEEFEDEKKRLQRILDEAEERFGNAMKKLESKADDVLENPTVAEYNKASGSGFFQQCRAVNAAIAVLKHEYPKLKPYVSGWNTASDINSLPTTDGKEVADRVKQVIKLIKKTEAAIN